MASAVCVPWPISLRFMASITLPSARDLDPAVEAHLARLDRQRIDRCRGDRAAAARPSRRRARRPRPRPLTSSARRLMRARPAALRIAARRRGYVPQRQTLAIAASISASLGLRFLASKRSGRHQDAALAVAALRHLVRDPGALQRMRHLGAAERLDRDDATALAARRSAARTSAPPRRRRAPCRHRRHRRRSRTSCR